MIKRIVVAGIINESAHVIYDIVVKAQRCSMVKAMIGNTWEEVDLEFFESDQEVVCTVPRDWHKTTEFCNWLNETYKPMQVVKSMPVRVGSGGVMQVIRLGKLSD